MVGPEVQEKSRLLAVLSLMDHTRLSFWPSTQAAGIVILACLSTGHDHLCSHVMEVLYLSLSFVFPLPVIICGSVPK